MGKGGRLKRARTADARCIFCGDPVASREHLWPNWLRHSATLDHAEVNHTQVQALATMLDESTFYVAQAPLAVHSGPLSKRKVPVTCSTRCNSGWMARLEENAKRVLLPMIDGERSILTADDQRVMARWADKSVVVAETTSPSTAVSTQVDRERIMREDDPGPARSTRVWVGKVQAVSGSVGFHHRSATYADLTQPGLDKGRGRSDVIVAGHLLIFVLGFTRPEIGHLLPAAIDALGDKLLPIWPTTSDPLTWPPPTSLTTKEVLYLSNSLRDTAD